jgi:hypothetical protein
VLLNLKNDRSGSPRRRFGSALTRCPIPKIQYVDADADMANEVLSFDRSPPSGIDFQRSGRPGAADDKRTDVAVLINRR